MRLRVGSFLVLALLFSSAPAPAEFIVDLTDGVNDSGWSAVLADGIHNGIVVDKISADYVRIEISKTLLLGPEGGVFPANFIEFRQRLDNAHTLPTIQITSEAVTNDTGWDWTDYHWEIIGDDAAFDKAATDASGFSIAPFLNIDWGPTPDGWSADYARILDVDGGDGVPHGDTFYPGSLEGRLYVDVNLWGDPNASFTLKQNPTPEPCAMSLLAGGASVLLLGRRKRKRA